MKAIAEHDPNVQLTGLDADLASLEIAERKLGATDTTCELVLGRSPDMPFADDSFDKVVSTLIFHHLQIADKQTSTAEVVRVLRPGGSVHDADWGRPTGPVQRPAFYRIQLLDGFASTHGHVTGKLPLLFQEAVCQAVEEIAFLRTIFGTLRLVRTLKQSPCPGKVLSSF